MVKKSRLAILLLSSVAVLALGAVSSPQAEAVNLKKVFGFSPDANKIPEQEKDVLKGMINTKLDGFDKELGIWDSRETSVQKILLERAIASAAITQGSVRRVSLTAQALSGPLAAEITRWKQEKRKQMSDFLEFVKHELLKQRVNIYKKPGAVTLRVSRYINGLILSQKPVTHETMLKVVRSDVPQLLQNTQDFGPLTVRDFMGAHAQELKELAAQDIADQKSDKSPDQILEAVQKDWEVRDSQQRGRLELDINDLKKTITDTVLAGVAIKKTTNLLGQHSNRESSFTETPSHSSYGAHPTTPTEPGVSPKP